jgi:thiol-disulfide isomerase/thioredoxin
VEILLPRFLSAPSSSLNANSDPSKKLNCDSSHTKLFASFTKIAHFMIMIRMIFLMLLLYFAAAPTVGFGESSGEIKIGETLPDAMMRGLNGPPKKLSEFRGRPLIINVWASWCGPCRAEMASLERLAWLEESGYFSVIGVSTDDYSERAKGALQASNATISHFIDSRLRIENMLGASRIPLTVLVDADGRVVEKIYGAREWDGPDALKLIGEAFGKQQDKFARVRTLSRSDDAEIRR